MTSLHHLLGMLDPQDDGERPAKLRTGTITDVGPPVKVRIGGNVVGCALLAGAAIEVGDEVAIMTRPDCALVLGRADGSNQAGQIIHLQRETADSATVPGASSPAYDTFSVTLPANRRVRIDVSGVAKASGGGSTERAAFVELHEGSSSSAPVAVEAWLTGLYDAVEGRRKLIAVTSFILDTGAGGAQLYRVFLTRVGGSDGVLIEGTGQPFVVVFTDAGPA